MRSVLLINTSILAAALFVAGPAFAQEAASPSASGSAPVADTATGTATGMATGGDIIVTARKRNERLLDVPVAVSAMTGEQLERYATTSLEAIAQQTPQLIISESQNQVGGSINLRGIGAGTANPSTEQAVTLNLDGVQVSYGNAIRLGQFDLQRVEVLKGPQALFFGKNSPGGIVSLISNDPGPTFEAQVRGGYEFAAKQRFVEGIVSGPLGEGFGVRLVGYYSKQDGWFRNVGIAIPNVTPGPVAKTANSEEKFVRGTLAYTSPGGDLSVKLKLNYGERDRSGIGPAALNQLFSCPFGAAQLGGGITTDCKLDRDFTSVALPASTAALHPRLGNGQPRLASNQFLGSLSIDYNLTDTLTLSAVSGYYRAHEDTFDTYTFTSIPAVAAANDLHNKAFSQELRLSSDFDGPLNFLVGGYYQTGDFRIQNVLVITPLGGSPAVSPVNYFDQDTRAWSLFGQARYKLTEQFEVSAGGRLSRERKTLTGTVDNLPISILNPTRKYRNFSPEFTATYKPDTDLTLYASWREGFTSGGFNTAGGVLRTSARPTLPLRDLSFEQMTAKGAELGFKGYVLDHQLRFDLGGYYYKYKGLQLSRFDPVAIAQTTQNAAGAKVRGLESTLVFRPNMVEGLELHNSVAWNKADYTDFIGGCYGGQSIAQGCSLVPRDATLAPSTYGTAANPYTSQDQSGQALTRAPRWMVNAGIVHDQPIGNGLALSFAADATYTSSYYAQTEGSPRAIQRGYWQFDGSIALNGHDKGWQLALIGRNLTNRLVAVSASAASFSGGGTGTAAAVGADNMAVLNSPRSVMLQLTVKSGLFDAK